MGTEQGRARTKQVLCNQQLAAARDEPQSRVCTHSHKVNTAPATCIYSAAQTLWSPLKQHMTRYHKNQCTQLHMFIHVGKGTHTLDFLDLVLEAQPQIQLRSPFFLHLHVSVLHSSLSAPPQACFARLPLIPLWDWLGVCEKKGGGEEMRDTEKHVKEEDKGGSDSLTTTRFCGREKQVLEAFLRPFDCTREIKSQCVVNSSSTTVTVEAERRRFIPLP